MKIITIFLHRRITMKITMINNYNWITIYFYIFIFMLNFFLLFVDCILQTIGNDIKSSSYIMYFIKILYHETKVLIINCDEDSLKFCHLIVVMKFYIKIVVMKIRWSSISKLLWWSMWRSIRWNIRWNVCWNVCWNNISQFIAKNVVKNVAKNVVEVLIKNCIMIY